MKFNPNLNVKPLKSKKTKKSRNLQKINTVIHTDERVNLTIHPYYTMKH
jgi:hypothetical protein